MRFFSVYKKFIENKRPSNTLSNQLLFAINWLESALKNSKDNGVPQTYFIKKKMWGASYPETTGYIIPTFFDYASLTDNRQYFKKALLMADWECDVQMPEGAVQAGTIADQPARPTIFNTGQVLFGWARAYEETKKKRYLASLTKAADWLCKVQDADGSWRKFGSTMTSTSVNTYNTRSAWGLIEAYKSTRDEKHKLAAVQNIEWALTQQADTGWWHNNCLLDNNRPFTHTIAYAMRGFLETGDYLDRHDFLDAAIKAADALLKKQRFNGSWAGQYDRNWKAQCRWSCLTGNSQLAINFIRLSEITGDKKYFDAAVKANRYNMSVQNTDKDNPDTFGAIAGSWPIHGKYHPYQYPNWAAKFFADALMGEIKYASGQAEKQ